MDEPTNLTIADLGEQELLQRLYRYCHPEAVGDDAALLAIEPDHELVVTTDMLVDGTHFSVGLATPQLQTTSPFDAGWRSAAANLSDLAAMGAQPLGITVALGLPPTLPYKHLAAFYQGLQECLAQYQTAIIGGDVCRAPVWSVSITALGQVQPSRKILRSQAQVGDVILVTGVHGASRAGLELLRNPNWGKELSPTDRNTLIRSHQRPVPRLDIPPMIWELDPKARVAGMDSSDGLADAVLQVCHASGVGATLAYERLPIPDCLKTMRSLSEDERIQYTLYGGEDFELVLFLEPKLAEALQSQLKGQVQIMGRTHPQKQVTLIHSRIPTQTRVLTLEQGFQHFSE